jgi:predicted transcriptional regulator
MWKRAISKSFTVFRSELYKSGSPIFCAKWAAANAKLASTIVKTEKTDLKTYIEMVDKIKETKQKEDSLEMDALILETFKQAVKLDIEHLKNTTHSSLERTYVLEYRSQ